MSPKVTEDLLIVGKREVLDAFMMLLRKCLLISKAVNDDNIRFNGFLIRQESNGDDMMSMSEYADQVDYMDKTRERSKQADEKVTDQSFSKLKSLAGSLMWLGGGVSPR